jgi:hypothetical protein
MAINIDTTSAKYQNYLTGLANLKTDMLPRLKAFTKLSREKQTWWLERDPLLRRLIKLGVIMNKFLDIIDYQQEVEND